MALAVAAAGLAAGAVSIVTFRDPLLLRWHALRLELSRPADRWALARRLEGGGEAARRAVEDWYLATLEAWSPEPAAIASRKPADAVSVPGDPVEASRGDPTFHYPEEEDAARAGARLGALRSLRAIPLLERALVRSDPSLPQTIASWDASLSLVSLYRLHFTAAALVEIGPESIPAVLRALRHEKANVGTQGALALRALRARGAELDSTARRALAAALLDSGPCVRDLAAEWLRSPDVDLLDVLPAILEGVEAASGEVPEWLGRLLLEKARPRQGEVDDAILRGLRGRTLAVKARLWLLGVLGESLSDRGVAWGGLLSARGTALVPVLVELLEDSEPSIRRAAADAVGGAGIAPHAVYPPLAKALRGDPDADVRRAAAAALRNLAPVSWPALPSVRQALSDPDQEVRRIAREVLDRFGERRDEVTSGG